MNILKRSMLMLLMSLSRNLIYISSRFPQLSSLHFILSFKVYIMNIYIILYITWLTWLIWNYFYINWDYIWFSHEFHLWFCIFRLWYREVFEDIKSMSKENLDKNQEDINIIHLNIIFLIKIFFFFFWLFYIFSQLSHSNFCFILSIFTQMFYSKDRILGFYSKKKDINRQIS